MRSPWIAVVSSLALGVSNALELSVLPFGSNASSPLLYGLMFEDINNSGDGGVYSQMIRNNGFQGDPPGLDPWAAVGNADILRDNEATVGKPNHPTILIQQHQGNNKPFGVSNGGYYGNRVFQQKYTCSFFLKGAYDGKAKLSLVSAKDGTVFGSGTVKVNSNDDNFTYHETAFDVKKNAPDGDNLWQITFDAAKATSGSMNLGFPLLFPTTFNDRPNGLNREIAEAMDAIGGSFLRAPGGNNIEGNSIDDRWIWNNTIGRLEDRKGRQGTWGYPNTDGLGLMEYMYWMEDMNLTPVWAVWSGEWNPIDGGTISGDALKPYVQEAMDELEFLLGDVTTQGGALRASLGHPAPFKIPYVEVGNEDWFNGGAESYPARFQMFYDAIHAKYPDIHVISTISTLNSDVGVLPVVPPGVVQDVHGYFSPGHYVTLFNEFDNWNRSQPVLVGEYAVISRDDGSRLNWTTVQSSVAEAVYMIGLERNSDVVIGAAYAPMLEHFGVAEWTPDLFGWDPTNGVTRSTSYFVQQMFASNRGDTVHLVDPHGAGFGPVYWVASSKDNGRVYYVKMANYADSSESIVVNVPGMKKGKLTVLTGQKDQSNTPGEESVLPHSQAVNGWGGSFELTLPAWSVAVLALSA